MSVRNKENAEHYTWGGSCDGWRLLSREDLSVIQERIPPGLGEVLHYHTRARQLFYIIKGQLDIELSGEKIVLASGDCLEIAPLLHHRVTNTSNADAHFLVISFPSTTNDRVNLTQ